MDWMYFYGSDKLDKEITVEFGLIFCWNFRNWSFVNTFPNPVLGIPIPAFPNAVLLTS